MSIPPRARRKAGPVSDELLRDVGDGLQTTTTNVERGKFVGARVTRSTDFVTTAGVEHLMTYDTTRVDTDNFFDGSTRLVVPFAGFWLVTAAYTFNTGTFWRASSITAGGTTVGRRTTSNDSRETALESSVLLYLEADEYVESVVRTATGGTVLSSDAGSIGDTNDWLSPEFSISLVGVFRPVGDF